MPIFTKSVSSTRKIREPAWTKVRLLMISKERRKIKERGAFFMVVIIYPLIELIYPLIKLERFPTLAITTHQLTTNHPH